MMTRSQFFDSAMMMAKTLLKASAVPSEPPPNFMVKIAMIPSFSTAARRQR